MYICDIGYSTSNVNANCQFLFIFESKFISKFNWSLALICFMRHLLDENMTVIIRIRKSHVTFDNHTVVMINLNRDNFTNDFFIRTRRL